MKKKQIYPLVIAVFLGLFITMPSSGRENTISIRDALGRQVVLRKVPQRIISLAPVNTEILFALGLGKKVVGVTTFCNYPPAALSITKIGDFCTINREKIISLRPDVVFAATGVQMLTVKELEKIKIKVVVIDAKSIRDIYDCITLTAKICGVPKKAESIIQVNKSQINEVESKVAGQAKKPRIFYEVGDGLYTAGANSFINDLINRAGGINIAGSIKQDYPIFSIESLLSAQPDIYLSNTDNSAQSREDLLRRPGFTNLICLQKNRCYFLKADLISRPGPRVGLAVRELAKIFYPALWRGEK